jgi:hypothetical protein
MGSSIFFIEYPFFVNREIQLSKVLKNHGAGDVKSSEKPFQLPCLQPSA